jgi:hypothetical protein
MVESSRGLSPIQSTNTMFFAMIVCLNVFSNHLKALEAKPVFDPSSPLFAVGELVCGLYG